MAQKAKKGRGSLGSPHPFGYRIVHGQYVQKPTEADAVRRIFAQYLAGESLERIARALDRDGVPTKRGGKWRKQTVAAILANPLYCGHIEWDGNAAPGHHDPLVSAEVFEEAREEGRKRRTLRAAHGSQEPISVSAPA